MDSRGDGVARTVEFRALGTAGRAGLLAGHSFSCSWPGEWMEEGGSSRRGECSASNAPVLLTELITVFLDWLILGFACHIEVVNGFVVDFHPF